MLEDAVRRLSEGIPVDGFLLHASDPAKGRFKGEVDLSVHMSKSDARGFLMRAKLFYGAGPDYRPWVELYGIQDPVRLGTESLPYFDSRVEGALLELFSVALDETGSLFVEYSGDPETLSAIRRDVPAPVTRLGFRLLELGFTWFKVWYFPEGGSEGSEKLQAEKPGSEKARARHLSRIREEASAFVQTYGEGSETDSSVHRALERARQISTKTEEVDRGNATRSR
jgi:hypothetical protein